MSSFGGSVVLAGGGGVTQNPHISSYELLYTILSFVGFS